MDKSIEQMGQDLAFGEYSKSTREQYLRSAKELGAHFGRPVTELARDDLRAYVELLRGRGRSASWLKMKLGGIVFLYEKTLGRPQDVSFVVWPKQHSPLPTVLSQQEVAAVIEALERPVYRAIAMVLYGAGLRIDEALSLEVGDIDGARGVLRVRHGKGDRARDARLSPGLHRTGYAGPKPPPGKPHRYRFHVYALDQRADWPPGMSRMEFETAIRGHALAEGVLEAVYGRK